MEQLEDLNGLMSNRVALELIVILGSVDDEDSPTTVEVEAKSKNWDRKVGSGDIPPVPWDARISMGALQATRVRSIVNSMLEAPGDRSGRKRRRLRQILS